MIYFNDVNGSTIGGMPSHVGTSSSGRYQTANIVAYVQADGDELIAACEILQIAVPKRRVWVFAGDAARTIFLNWR